MDQRVDGGAPAAVRGRYIAVRDREVVDVDEDFEALLARVRGRPDPESVTIEPISATEYVWAL